MMRYGLVGKTLAHSYSKEIHESLGRYEYDLFSLSSDETLSEAATSTVSTSPYRTRRTLSHSAMRCPILHAR